MAHQEVSAGTLVFYESPKIHETFPINRRVHSVHGIMRKDDELVIPEQVKVIMQGASAVGLSHVWMEGGDVAVDPDTYVVRIEADLSVAVMSTLHEAKNLFDSVTNPTHLELTPAGDDIVAKIAGSARPVPNMNPQDWRQCIVAILTSSEYPTCPERVFRMYRMKPEQWDECVSRVRGVQARLGHAGFEAQTKFAATGMYGVASSDRRMVDVRTCKSGWLCREQGLDERAECQGKRPAVSVLVDGRGGGEALGQTLTSLLG
jgi:hypothetical protein